MIANYIYKGDVMFSNHSTTMQAFIAIVLVCFALSAVNAYKVPPLIREKFVETYNVCKSKTGATESETDIIDNLMVPTSEAGKCLLECMMTTEGFLKGGKLDVENLKKLAEQVFADVPEKSAKILKSIDECSNINVDGLDKCSAATAFYGCSMHSLE